MFHACGRSLRNPVEVDFKADENVLEVVSCLTFVKTFMISSHV